LGICDKFALSLSLSFSTDMKVIALFIVWCVCFAAPFPAYAQASANDNALSAAFHFTDSVFHRDTFLFQTVEPDIPADMANIIVRFNNAIASNKQWFLDYKSRFSVGGKPLPYNENFGITPDEYRRLQHLETPPPQLVPVDSQEVKVIRADGYIRFKGDSGNGKLLEYLEINVAGRQLIYGGDTIPFLNRAISGPSDPYGQWQGYAWRLERTDADAATDSAHLSARVVEVDMGLPFKGDHLFLRIKYEDVNFGMVGANMELLGFVK
jgi:hypothetical protein